jgi:enoyl-CoA hydratase/carnithine racemase
MTLRFITVIIAERIAIVTLNNPPANTLNSSVLKELDQVFGELEAEDAAGVIILTAAGRFFCAGGDIKELAQLNTAAQGADLSRRGQALLNRIERFDKPVIAAINGVCLGGGLELAMACHIRVAAAGAPLGLPEISLGLIPGFGGTQRLPRIIGPSQAAELILTGEPITAEQAFDLGLVNRVVAVEQVLPQARILAAIIASKGRLAIQSALRAIRTGLDSPLAEGLACETDLFASLCETADKKEGTHAFLEKRKPKFM